MKNIIFLLFSISFCLSIASQNDSINVTLEKSEVFKEKKSSVLKTIYKDEQHNLYTVRLLESGKSLLIDVFDKELQKQNSYEHNVAKRHEIAGGFLNNNTLGYIEYFKKVVAAGGEVQPIVQPNKEEVNFYYPITTNTMCLQCHGKPDEQVKTETLTMLKNLYPADKAVGYDVNEVRGIWAINFEEE